jgi:uncharacterized SAM-dependent methyltransferase
VAPCAYVPIDISGDFLRASAGALQEDFPDLPILPLEGDFMRTLELPEQVRGATKLGFFPGSTIGNMVPRTAVDLLRAMKDTLGSGAWLLIGMDRIKDVDVLLAAYDDAQGITAQFNLNLLHRINAELEGDIDVSAWRHRAIWNDARGRIEMHLEAVNATGFTIAGQHFAFAPARRSTRRTATNMAIATRGCCCWRRLGRRQGVDGRGGKLCDHPRPGRGAAVCTVSR